MNAVTTDLKSDARKVDAKPGFRPLFVEDVFRFARTFSLTADIATAILNRELGAGQALAWQLAQTTRTDTPLWLNATQLNAHEHPIFLARPYDQAGPSALETVRTAGGVAGIFWRQPNLDKYADILGWPPAMLAHVVCGSLWVKSQRWVNRLARILKLDEPNYTMGNYILPKEHPLWVRSSKYNGGSR